MLKEFNLYEKCYLILGTILLVIIAIVSRSNILSLIYSLLCLLNAVCIAKGKIIGYVFEIIATIIYLYISFTQKFYSEVFTSICLLMPSSIYGLYNWSKNQSQTSTVIIKDMSKKELYFSIISQIILYPLYLFVLDHFNSSLIYISALSICITALAVYHMAKASPLAYFFFIIKDIVGISLWIYPILLGESGSVTVFVTFLLYGLNDCYGLFNWKKIKASQQFAQQTN